MEKWIFLTLPGLEPQPLGCPTRTQFFNKIFIARLDVARLCSSCTKTVTSGPIITGVYCSQGFHNTLAPHSGKFEEETSRILGQTSWEVLRDFTQIRQVFLLNGICVVQGFRYTIWRMNPQEWQGSQSGFVQMKQIMKSRFCLVSSKHFW
jgi:hypothetical protein